MTIHPHRSNSHPSTRLGYSWTEEERQARLERRTDRDGGRETTTLPSTLPSIRSLLSPPRHPPSTLPLPRRSTSSLPRLYGSCLPACLPVRPSTFPLAYSSSLILSFLSPSLSRISRCCPRFRLVLLCHPLPPVKTQTIGDHYHHPSHPHATAGSKQAYRTAELSVVITSYLHPFVVGGAAAALYLPFCPPRERTSRR